MSKGKTRSLMRRLVVLKWIADFEPEGLVIAIAHGWPVTPDVRRLEKEGLIKRYRTRAVPKRSPLFRFMRSKSGGGPARLTKLRITPAGMDLLAKRYRAKEAEALLSESTRCRRQQCGCSARCLWLCHIAEFRRMDRLLARQGGVGSARRDAASATDVDGDVGNAHRVRGP